MKKKQASQETVNAFIKAVYPEIWELSMAMGSEESILKDATEKIAALEAKMKEKDATTSRLKNALCDRTISWEDACRLLREQDEQCVKELAYKDHCVNVQNILHNKQIASLKAESDAWKSVFGTTQLTHARARLEQVEKINTKQAEQIATLTESLNEWKNLCFLMRTANKQAKKQIAALTAENKRLGGQR